MRKSNEKYRLMFYTHDGAGLGHLTRISRIAKSFFSKNQVECLIVSGFREMSFVVNKDLLICKLPSRDTMIEERANYWGQHSFIDIDPPMVYQWRQCDMEFLFEMYKPDAFFIDYYILGKRDELSNIVKKYYASTFFYYINRGIIGCEASVKNQVLTEKNCLYLDKYFKRIFLTNDQTIFNFITSYQLSQEIKKKCHNVGYISHYIPKQERELTRKLRNLNSNVWIVCTAGGGKLGECFIEQMVRLASDIPNADFDIIAGPRNSIIPPQKLPNNCRYHVHMNNLPNFIAAADICITTGGYNTITEAMSNDTALLIQPSQLEKEDEQYFHALLLAQKIQADILIRDEEDLKRKIHTLIEQKVSVDYTQIDMNGLATIKQMVLSDLKNKL